MALPQVVYNISKNPLREFIGCKNVLNFTCLTMKFHNFHHTSLHTTRQSSCRDVDSVLSLAAVAAVEALAEGVAFAVARELADVEAEKVKKACFSRTVVA